MCLFLFQIGGIKSNDEEKSEMTAWLFLFQIGAIKSCPCLASQSSRILSFYSKLVRLKVILMVELLIQIGKFLFQIGAIKSKVGLDIIDKLRGFYSKLVRLKAVISTHSMFALDVSIPNWCD